MFPCMYSPPCHAMQDSAVLRQLVVRLSEQLSRQQGRPPLESGLLSRLCDTRRLPPLLDAYDQVRTVLVPPD